MAMGDEGPDAGQGLDNIFHNIHSSLRITLFFVYNFRLSSSRALQNWQPL